MFYGKSMFFENDRTISPLLEMLEMSTSGNFGDSLSSEPVRMAWAAACSRDRTYSLISLA